MLMVLGTSALGRKQTLTPLLIGTNEVGHD